MAAGSPHAICRPQEASSGPVICYGDRWERKLVAALFIVSSYRLLPEERDRGNLR